MASRPDELEEFKTRINLSEFAASLGYALDRKTSSRNSATMAHPDGDKVIVARGRDGHWVYFSVRDPADCGTVIDFAQRRGGGSLGDVRKALRPWLHSMPGSPTAPPPVRRPAPELYAASLEPITHDLVQVRARFEAMRPLSEIGSAYHPYLVEERAIPPELLALPLFASRVRIDGRSNAVFPHFNHEGLCGYEIKNRAFTGFAPGGIKGLWASRITPQDHALVIAETAIDALSYAVLSGTHRRRFVSIAGQLNPDQPALLASAFRKLPDGGRVILALDNDEGGDDLAERITPIFEGVGRADLRITDDRPSFRGADWNDVLRTTPPPLPEPGHG